MDRDLTLQRFCVPWGAGSRDLLLTLDRLEAAYSAMNPNTHFDNQLRGNDSALGGLYVGAADVAFITKEPSYIELDGYQQMIQGNALTEPWLRGLVPGNGMSRSFEPERLVP